MGNCRVAFVPKTRSEKRTLMIQFAKLQTDKDKLLFLKLQTLVILELILWLKSKNDLFGNIDISIPLKIEL